MKRAKSFPQGGGDWVGKSFTQGEGKLKRFDAFLKGEEMNRDKSSLKGRFIFIGYMYWKRFKKYDLKS